METLDRDSATKFIIDNHQTLSMTQLARETGLSNTATQNILKKQGLEAKQVKRTFLAPFQALSDNEVAYLAGLIDAEGTITICRHEVKGKIYFRGYISLVNTSYMLRNWFTERGFSVKDTDNRGQMIWKVSMGGRATADVAKRLLPYLKMKRLPALAVINLVKAPNDDESNKLYEIAKKFNRSGDSYEKFQTNHDYFKFLEKQLESQLG